MAFSFQDIRYGWVALASLGVITGTMIYVANNTRQQVKPEDIIEIALGTYERCLATQTTTNPTYSVTPPSFVRTWTSNVYSTNGVTVYTNIVTNTIGWHIDRDMLISLDTTIKALVPYYVDTNTVFDGTTNIVMLTVTGLWASLGIGDKTNKFTRTPCWTNPVSTNWTVNYTSYWPSTNGTATNINYTSDYRQVVTYAQSWTATGGHVWVTSSNWASSVVTVTNAATYGDYPWQIYVEDLQERYKVLNALKKTISQQENPSWSGVKYKALEIRTDQPWKYPGVSNYPSAWSYISAHWNDSTNTGGYGWLCAKVARSYSYSSASAIGVGAWNYFANFASVQGLCTNIGKSIQYYIIGGPNSGTFRSWGYYGYSFSEPFVFDANGVAISPNWSLYLSVDVGFGSSNSTVSVGDESLSLPNPPGDTTVPSEDRPQGFYLMDARCLFDWQFNYCLNKYW